MITQEQEKLLDEFFPLNEYGQRVASKEGIVQIIERLITLERIVTLLQVSKSA